VVVWLREGRLSKLSKVAIRELERAEQLLISPIVKLELYYLHESGKLTLTKDKMLDAHTLNFNFELSNASFSDICEVAESLSWTRDVFDRLIVAEAKFANAKLITKDSNIHKHYKKSVW